MLALHVLVNQTTLKRSGPEERVRGGDVIEGGRLHVLQQTAQPGRLELKHAVRIARLQQPKGRGIVPGNGGEVEFEPAGEAEILERVFDDREVAQSEKVHF